MLSLPKRAWRTIISLLATRQRVFNDLPRPDKSPINSDAKRWLLQASQDLDTAQILFDAARYGPCAFYCQQVAEK